MRIIQALWLVPLALVIGFGSVLGYFIGEEIRHSKFQSEYFSEIASGINFKKGRGSTPDFLVPLDGPYNHRLGYSFLPFYLKTLQAEGYEVVSQMRTSPRFQKFVRDGIYPIYHPKTTAGLLIKDRKSEVLYRARFPSRVFPNFESIPSLLVETLLFIENRELLRDGKVTRNPVIEWDRLAYAAFGQLLKKFVPAVNLGGGSTLATQIEKFRFSPNGQTSGPVEKIRQIVSGSLRVYLDGPDTRAARRKIVLDYLNSTPLSGRVGFGEINSIGDGLWVWFGRELRSVISALNLDEENSRSLEVKAKIYREVLGLILAQRRPTKYLVRDRPSLDNLIEGMLDKLERNGIISVALRDATRGHKLQFLPKAPPLPQMSFLDHKASNYMRSNLLSLLGLKKLYELDRVDVTATSTLDAKAQKEVTGFLKNMSNPEFLKSMDLYGEYLLSEDNNPSAINWSVLIYEKTKHGNVLRVQTDNIDGPLDMNEGVKLDLGSTAKLRTLVTYLEIIDELHSRYVGLSASDLHELKTKAPDVLTLWATSWLARVPDATLDEMLHAAMDRRYSANPNETFFTGGGAHKFSNFSNRSDYSNFDLWEALQRSENLVFIRLMRDVVNYTIAQGPQTKRELLSDPDHPARRKYLERFAAKEGLTFLRRYVRAYDKLKDHEIIHKISVRARRSAIAQTILYRLLYPKGHLNAYLAYMKLVRPQDTDHKKLEELFDKYPSDRYTLADCAYITGLNPLELWLVGYKLANPEASRKKILAVSKEVRIDSYAWLFQAKRKGAQDTRIRILLERDAFARIQNRWARLGYPFNRLVPSLATAIGTSADKPASLAKLVGILSNDGVLRPVRRLERLEFAHNTPYETEVRLQQNGIKRVLSPEVARVARKAMVGVVEGGTARRVRGAYVSEDGKPLVVGAKTGTGDHRYEEYNTAGKVISSRVVNRTGTIIFFIGDHLFGTVTAHVAGKKAGNYKFTSALSAQVLKKLAPSLQSLITPNGVKYPPVIEEVIEVVPPLPLPQSMPVPEEEGMPSRIVPFKETVFIEIKPSVERRQKSATREEKKVIIQESSQDMMMDILP